MALRSRRRDCRVEPRSCLGEGRATSSSNGKMVGWAGGRPMSHGMALWKSTLAIWWVRRAVRKSLLARDTASSRSAFGICSNTRSLRATGAAADQHVGPTNSKSYWVRGTSTAHKSPCPNRRARTILCHSWIWTRAWGLKPSKPRHRGKALFKENHLSPPPRSGSP